MLPEPSRTRMPARTYRRLSRIRNDADFAIQSHEEQAWQDAEIDRVDSEALGLALGRAFDVEAKLYRHGIASAGESAVLRELMLRKLELLSDQNLSRIARRFRG